MQADLPTPIRHRLTRAVLAAALGVLGTSVASLPAAPAQAQLTESARIRVAETLQRSAVSIRAGQSTGSGFIASREGWIVTNAHVVRGHERMGVQVRLGTGRIVPGAVVAFDPQHDLSVIATRQRVNIPALPLGDADTVRVGQTVLAFGSPFGLDGTLTQGIVSARRDLPGIGGGQVQGLIQTDAPINPGNSGGPLVNSAGEVIGVNTAILSRAGGSVGIGFAVPVNYVKQLLDQVRARQGQPVAGRQTRQPVAGTGAQVPQRGPQPAQPAEPSLPVWLGLFGEDFDAQGVHGVQVQRVVLAGPAARAGLLGSADHPPALVRQMNVRWTGHIILAVDGRPVRGMDDLRRALAGRRPGERVTLFVTVGPGVVSGETVVQLAPPPRN